MDVDSNGVSQALSSIEAALNSIQKAINNVQSAQGSLDSRISGKIGGFGGAISSLTSALSSTKTIISECDEYISETSDAILFLQNLTSELLGDMTNDDILSLGKGPLNKEFLEDPEGYMKKINDEKAKKELKEKLIEYGFSKADAERITRGEIDNDILQQRISEVQSEIFNEYCNGNSARYEQLVTAALFNGLYFSRSESTDRKKEIETSISELETGKKTSKKERELYEKAINGAKYDSKNGVYVYNDNGSIRTFDKVSFEMLKEMRDSAISNEEAYDAQIKLLNEELKEIDIKLSDPTRKDFTYKSMAEIDARIKEITNSQQGKTEEEKKTLETEKEELLYIKAAIEANVQYALENDKYRYQSDFEENSGFNADETREITHFENGGNIVINIFGIEDGKYTFMDNDEYRGALLSRMLNGDAKIIPDFQGSALNVVGDSQEFYFYGNERQLLFKEYQDWINASTEKGENEPVVITLDEIKIFNYICKTDKDGYAAGYRYLKEKEMEFDKRFTEIKAAEDSANAHANGWLGALSLFTAVPEAIMNTGKIITRKRSGQQLHLSDSYSTSNTWNATISSDMHKYSDVLGYAYDTLYSADRMLLSAVTSYATGGTGTLTSIATNGVMYGLPTFTSTVHTSKTKGIDDDRALRYALVCATARTLATSYTLTKASGLESTFNNMLTNGNVMSRISSIVSGSSILSKNPELAKNVLLAGYCMVSQGTVAGTTAVVDKTLTSVADTLINGDMSDVNIKFKNYKELHEGCSDFEAYMNIAGDNLSNSFSTYISAFGPGALLGMVKASGIIEHQKTLPQNINFKEAFEIDKKDPQEEFVSSGNNNPSGGGPSGGLRPSSNPSSDSGLSGKNSDNKATINSSGSSDWIVVKPKVPGEDDFDDFPDGINIKASNAFNAHAMQQNANGQDVTILGSETNGDASIGHYEKNHVEMAVDENGISVPNSTSVWVSESGLSSNQGSIQQVNVNDILNIDSANLPQSDSTIPNLTDSYGVKVPVESLIDGKPVDSFTIIDTKGNNDSFVLPFAPTLAGISATGNTSLLSKLQATGSLSKTDWCKLTGAFTEKQLAEVKKLEDIETNIANNGNKVTKEDFNYLYKKSGLPLNFQKKIQQKFETDGLITEKYATDSTVDSADKNASSSSPDLYHVDTMPQSEIPKRQEAITKILKGEKLNIGDRLALGGRDHVVKEIDGYQLKPDHVYRVTDIKAWEDYVKNGKIVRNVPDFIPGENNGGVDWYLGGAANPTGRYSDGENTIIIEAPADKKYFTPSLDNGLGMADDISVRHMKSSSQANPVPLSMVKVIKGQDVIDNWTNIQKFKTILGKEISDVSQNKDGTITVTTRYGEKLNITKDGLNSQNFEHEILEKNREHENALKNDVTSTFYHGGVTSDFDKSQIDILHKGEKQSTKNSNYSGFYMYDDQNYDGAVGYAKKSGTDKGVVELTLSNDLKIHEVPPFKITRISPDEIKKLQDEGFDLIKGKMLGKDEYVLLNKDKIIETKFHNLNPNVSTEAESIDDDKSTTLKIDTDSLVKSIIGKDQLSDNQQRILSEQVARYMRLSAKNIASNPVHLDKDGKFELQAGDLIHVSNIGNLESIAQKGILTGQAVGVEEFMETYFCADFFRVPQKESLSTFTENFRENYTKGLPSDYDMSEPTIRSFDIGFVVTPTEQNKDLLSYDAYERKDSFSTENTAATRTFVNTKGLLDYEGAAPYATNGGYSSILYGVPASQISTIMIGNGWVVRDVEKTIQEYCDAQKYLVGFDSLKPVVEKQARRTFAKRGEKAGIEDYTVDKFIDKLHRLFPKANIVSYDGTVLYDASKNVANLASEQSKLEEKPALEGYKKIETEKDLTKSIKTIFPTDEYSSEYEVIDVSKIDTEKHDFDLTKGVDSNIMNMSYKGYDLVFKPNSDVDSVISEIVRENPAGKILLELESTKGLTIENLSLLPDNVEIRVLGDYGIEYFNGFPSNYDENALASLNNTTYSISEMKEIMKVINDFDSGIQSSWDDDVKAEYAYQYLTEILVMGCRFVAEVGIENINNNKIYDGLVGLLNKSSSDKGFAHIYKELLNRMNIKCTEVQGIIKPPSKKDKGTLNLAGYHVFNVITIDGKNIIVDVSRDKMGPGYNGSGFGVINQSEYEFISSKELADNLITMRKLKLKRAAKYIKKKYTKNIKLANEGEIWDFESIFSGITSSNTERVKNLINWAKTEGIKKIIDFFDGKIDASKIDLNKLIILEEEEYYALLDAEGEDKSTLGFNLGNVSVIGVPSSVLVSSHIYEAIIHELLHQISNPDDYCFWDIDEETFYKISGFDILTNKGDLDRRITQLGDAPTPYKGFNEAVTDYFAGLIFPKGAHTSGYNNIVDGLKRILSLNIPGFNVETLKNSYLNNDITMFKNVIDEAIGEGFFENELCPAFNKAESGNSIYKQMLDETIDMLEMIIETNKLLLAKYGEQYAVNNKFDYAKFNKLFELFKTSEFSKKSFEEQIKMISGIVDYECLSVALKDIILEALDEMKIKNNDAASETVEHFEKQEETFESTGKNDETIATDTSKTIEDPKLTEENREGNWWDDDAFWDTSADDSISDLNQNANTMLLDEKKAIIEKYSKGEFTDFLTGDTDGRILSLLDAEGLKILGSSKLLEDRIRYILTYSKYKNELLTNKTFLDMFLKSNISDYYAVMNGLNFETYDAILNECVQRGDNNAFKELFTFFDREYKLKVLDNWSYSTDLLYEVFKTYNPEVMAKILSNYNIDLLSHNINLKSLFEAAKHSVLKAQESRYLYGKEIAELSIPVNMITTQMAQKLWENYDIFVLRKILNNANYSTDITVLNEYIKKQEEQLISDSLTTGMTGQFLSIYNAYSKMRQFDESSDEYYYARNELRTLLSKLEQFELMEELNQEYDKNGIDGVRDYILNLNNNSISNYIIDYHFEENYHNIMLDLKELLDFYYAGNVNIPLDRVGVYQKILNIDSLSLQEKIELHEQLKGMDIMGQFYDDMEVSRRIVGEAVRDYSLDSESIKQYRNDELSQKYGVDVYTIENNPFFAIVKTGRHQTDTAPTGHSYSLIGHGGIAVFGNVNDSNTYLYDASSLNPQQLVHVFPFDSFTLYRPFEYSDSATRRVNLLMMPDELMDKTGYSYNEMLILERGRNSTGIDETIPELQKMALYCIDNITEENVRIAKEQGVGIFLINSKNYHKQDSVPSSIYRHNIDKWNYDYFDGEFEREKFEKLRKLDQIAVKSDTEETINPQSNDKISASKLTDFLYKKNIINTSMYMKHVLKNGLYNFFDDESTEQNIISVLESLNLHYVSRNIIQRYNTENGFDYKGFLNYVLTHDKLGLDDIKRLEQLKDIQAIKTNPDAELTKIDALLDDIQRFVNGKDGSIGELNNTVFNYLSFLSYYVSRDVNFRIKNRNLLYRIARKLNKLSKQYIESKENSTIEYRGVKITTYGDDSQFLKTSLQRVLELIEKLPEALLKQFNALSTLKVFDSFNPGNLQALFEYEKIFNDPSETSFYSAANYNSEYDIMQIFRNGIENNSDRDLFSTISHELGHSLDNHMITPFGEYFTDKTDLWTKAIHSDNNSVSSYGDTMTIEDFAEMVGLYSQALLGYVDIKNVSQKHPARLRILKNLFDLNAFDDNNPSSLSFKRKLEILGTFDEALKDNTHIMESLLGSDLLKTFYNLSPDKKVSLARLMSEYGTNNQFVYLFLNDNYLSDFSSYQLLELCNIYMGKEIFGPMLLRIFVHFSEKDVINYTGILEGLSDLKKTNMDEFMFISTLKKYIKESETEGFNYLALHHTFMKYRHMVGSEVYYKALKLFFDNFK